MKKARFWLGALALLILCAGCKKTQTQRGEPSEATVLLQSARAGDVDAVRSLLADGADINGRSRYDATALHEALSAGHGETAKLLVAEGADVRAATRYGETPMHIVAELGNCDMVDLLLASGACVNAVNSAGRTPLLIEVESGHPDVAKRLIVAGAAVNATDKAAALPLGRAVSRAEADFVALLIASGADVNAEYDARHTTLLQVAARRGQKEIAGVLLNAGADINAHDLWGFTALHEALAKGHTDIARYLIAKGADTQTQTYDGETLLHVAAQRGCRDIVETVIARGADVNAADKPKSTPLLYAAKCGHLGVAKKLLAHGAAVNAVNKLGQTPLSGAVARDDPDLVRLLIDHGAELNSVGRYERVFCPYPRQPGGGYYALPLHIAAEKGSRLVAGMLLKAGADPNVTDSLGRTPAELAMRRGDREMAVRLLRPGMQITLHLAAYAGEPAQVRSLLERRADVNSSDDRGWTPLHMASSAGRRDIAELLVASGADVNARDNAGWTPLHEAAYQGDRDIVQLLVERGAAVNAGTTRFLRKRRGWGGRFYTTGTTPLHVAVEHSDVAEVLVAGGADLDARDREGHTALWHAIFQGEREAGRLLIDAGAEVGLFLAALVGHAPKVRSLIEAGADVNAQNERQETPLYLAVQGGHCDIADLLIAHGAEPDARCAWNQRHPMYWSRPHPADKVGESDGASVGSTALHHAVALGYTDVPRTLLARNADVNARDPFGRTPLHQAAYSGWVDLVKLLLAHGADTGARDDKGKSALEYARRAGFAEIVELLGGDTGDSGSVRRGPYMAIISDPNAVRNFLGYQGIHCDDVWIPGEKDIEGLENILKLYLQSNTAIRSTTLTPREPVLFHLRRYNREYGGFIRDGKRYILCNMHLGASDQNMFVSRRSANRFTIIADGYWAVVKVVFDLENGTVVRVDCNGGG